MKKSNFRILLLVTMLIVSSCVSKKKYLEMEAIKNRASQQSRELTKELQDRDYNLKSLLKEHESMKNQLNLSNAKKDAEIKKLNGQIGNLETKIDELHNDVSLSSSRYDITQNKLSSQISDKDTRIRQLQSQVNQANRELERIKESYNKLVAARSKEQEESVAIKADYNLKSKMLNNYTTQIEDLNTQIKTLNSQISAKNQEIEKLQNTCNLLRKELGM
ncbi:MAG: hypothetical protein ACK5MG_10080 [Bacteroidales bacterium]